MGHKARQKMIGRIKVFTKNLPLPCKSFIPVDMVQKIGSDYWLVLSDRQEASFSCSDNILFHIQKLSFLHF